MVSALIEKGSWMLSGASDSWVPFGVSMLVNLQYSAPLNPKP